MVDYDTITVPQEPPYTSLKQINFGDAANAPVTVPIMKQARLTWLNKADTADGGTTTGLHVDVGNPYIDQTCKGMKMAYVVVDHQSADDNGETKKAYWRLDGCSLIPMVNGIISPFQMDITQDRPGHVLAMEVELDKNKQPERYPDSGKIKKHLVLKLWTYVHEMILHGYREPLPLMLKGNTAKAMIDALARQIEVLDAYRAYEGKDAPFYGFAVTLQASTTKKMVGVAGGPQSPIYPPLPQIPATIDESYLLQQAVPADIVQEIYQNRIANLLRWSREESYRINAETAKWEGKEIPALAAPKPSDDSLVNANQIDWIMKEYCHENTGVLQAILEYFSELRGVTLTDVTQLTVGDCRELVKMKKKADAEIKAEEAADASSDQDKPQDN